MARQQSLPPLQETAALMKAVAAQARAAPVTRIGAIKARPELRFSGLERDVVVEVAREAGPAAGAGHGRTLLHGRGAAELAALRAAVVLARLAAAPAAVEDG